jgi:hypothetical protein
MSRNDAQPTRPHDNTDDYMRGGKGRKDDVRGSRIFSPGAPDIPDDAEVRSPGNLARHKGPARDDAEHEE